MPTYEPGIGTADFEGISCDLDCDDRNSGKHDGDVGDRREGKEDHEIRRFVVKSVLIAIIGALTITGMYGLVTANWDPVKHVYFFTAAPLGGILTTYIGKLDASRT